MHAMQYEITLPADYDMASVRHRVATRGSALDALAGLGLKAYLIRERGVDGSPVSQYAPFYLWTSLQGMNGFLWGDGFRGLSESFGRPVVQQWTGLAFQRGPAHAEIPRAATRRTEPVPADADPVATIDRAASELEALAGDPAVHSSALAIDTRGWELVHFTLWRDAAPQASGQRYEVLHLSRPHVDELVAGRHW
jgi:hypothetical protein